MEKNYTSDQVGSKSYLEVEKALTLRLQKLLINRAAVNRMEENTLSVIYYGYSRTDEKKGLYLPADFSRLAAWYESNQEFMRSFMEDTKRDFCELFHEESFDVWMIREAALIFLKSFQNNNACFLKAESKVYSWLRDEDIIRLANLATAMYLEAWLTRDKKSYQTPYGFAAHPYKIEDKLQKGKNKPSDGERSEIQRAFKHQETFYELRTWQIKQEGTPPMCERYTDGDYGHPVDLITLAWCEAYIKGGLGILDYLYVRENIMTRAEDVRSKREEGLATACKNYQEYIRDIHEIETHEKAPIENYRRFVASSMMLHRMERAYCFHMYGRAAERICNKSIDPQKYSPNTANIVLGRYSGTDDYLFVPLWAAGKDFNTLVKEWTAEPKATKRSKRPYVFSNEHMDVLDIDFYINHMFCVDGEEVSKIESELHWNRRCLIQDLLTFLFTLYPPAEQHTWMKDDFYKASIFYRYFYPITEEFLKVNFPSVQRKPHTKEEDFYYFFRRPYVVLSLNKKWPLSKGRKFYRSKKNKMIRKGNSKKDEK